MIPMQLRADIFGEEWLGLAEKSELSADEKKLCDKLEKILLLSGWSKETLGEAKGIDIASKLRAAKAIS